MANTVLDVMRARYITLMQMINSLENRRNSLPYGDIYIKNNHGYPQYYFHCNQEEKYLGKKDAGLISQLVQKEHIKIALKAARHEAEILKKDIIAYPRNTFEKVYETLPEERKKYADRLFFTFESADQPLDLSWLDEFIERTSDDHISEAIL